MKIKNNVENDFFYLFKEVWNYQRNLYIFYVLNLIFTLTYSLPNILAPRFMIVELTGQGRIEYILAVTAIYFLLIAVSGYLNSYIKYHYQIGISYIRYGFMEKTKEKIMKVQYKSLEDPKYLDEFWRVISATSDIEIGVQGILTQLFILSANSVTSFFYMGIISKLNLWIVLLLAVNIYLVYLFRSKAGKHEVEKSKEAVSYRRREQYLVNIMGDFAYGKDIRICGLSNFILKKLMDNHEPRHAIEVDIQRHHYLADFAESILSCVRDIIIYSYLIIGVLNGRISIADFTMFFMTVASLTIILEKVFEDAAFINSDMFRIAEMRSFLELPNEEAKGGNYIPIPDSDQYELTFEHVSFNYPGSDHNVYTDFNFSIKAGKKLAVVGINGAGKTTLVKLIVRLYEPTEGRILLNGTDIRKFALWDYRKLLTAVFQDINVFAMSLRENICCDDENFDEVKFRYALENAGLAGIYEQYGENHEIPLTRYLSDEGVDLSGGEKQKVGIARALYKDGKIMIFDEPTAALDAAAEYALYNKLAEISENKTLVFISHRLASTRFCDEIVLINSGKVAEMGTHEELMKQEGVYYKMFLAQKKYYEEGKNSHEEKLEEGVI